VATAVKVPAVSPEAGPVLISGPVSSPASSSSRVLELDGFRAFAVLMVLVHHLFFGWATPALASIPRVIRVAIGHGWLGVDLFFVLSGFLITGILIDSREGEHYFRNFYSRRILRIFPLYLTCILIMYFEYPRGGAYFRLSLLYLANFAYFFRVGTPHGPGVFWSLAVEEHFYLVWPLVVRLLRRTWLLGFSLLLVVGTPILRGVCAHAGMNPELQIYPYSFFRFDGLALGAILAIWVRSRHYSRSSAWKLAGLLAGTTCLIALIGLPYGITGSKTVVGTAFHYTQAEFIFAGLMALALAYRGSGATGFLRCRAARITADLSFCIYLIHLAVGDFFYRVLHFLGFDDVARLGAFGSLGLRILVVGTATFALAALSKKYLEDPFLRLKRYF
jgi:peptidoglycan/LPS O-acetylase OafA/YrhL